MALRECKATRADQLTGSKGLSHSLGHPSAANDQPPPPLGKTGTGKETSRNQASPISIRRDSEGKGPNKHYGWLVVSWTDFDLIISPRARAMILLRRAKSAWDYGLIGIVAELVKIGEDLARKGKKQLETARHSMPIMKE
ncbi:uncharacterized protein BO88DRAFT_426350 [Aspergillus vadensis CBS 113365]|uniref:Uncharacterized protein n=1 Tax=Aspergillus vadensis (strain CBS 113365 / IMI 142717 / IBT 24658) TaxID=1448311 RepID=A0A319B8U0_ASPVC|nr:hypothetical protein BO88DRAFT_426350 [Aspergillus vadensis CBS 113365]PYH68244.1 hypothetical protein BO88DRAFT_426350 [Aspergillus vadensis CBS 113365]